MSELEHIVDDICIREPSINKHSLKIKLESLIKAEVLRGRLDTLKSMGKKLTPGYEYEFWDEYFDKEIKSLEQQLKQLEGQDE